MKKHKLCLSLLLVFIFTAGNLYSQHEDSVEGDFQALMALYESTNGDDWYDRTGWADMMSQTMGDAVGIEVNSAGRVVSIDMQKVTTTTIRGNTGQHNGNNLTGTLPATIGNLKKVTYFNVKQNKIGGRIPSEIGLMESLEWLSLAGQRGDIEIGRGNVYDHRGQAGGKEFEESNAFTGELPPEIGGLQHLKVIEIRRQFITGTLPASWGNLPNIRSIFLNNQRGANSLGGSLPPEWGLLMNTLQDLDLQNGPASRDTEPTEYGQGFTGEIPGSWTSSTGHDEEVYFRFKKNNFTGSIPYFKNIRDFRILDFSGNNFTGNFPIEYFSNGNNSSIWLFSVENNILSGEIPGTFTAPHFPRPRSNYNNISILRLAGNNFIGPIPQWIQEMEGHVQVGFGSLGFTGKFPKTLAEQRKIRLFVITSNELSGDLPDVNWKSDDLYEVLISGNNFTGSIPESWSSMTQGERGVWRFYASSNELEGELPSWLADMPKLEYLYLHNNKFTFKDILPHYDVILRNLQSNASNGRSGAGGERFYIDDQKPFGTALNRTMPQGSELVLDMSRFHYNGNKYQWKKDGELITGATSHTYVIERVSSTDEGDYILEVSNPALPELETHTSKPITFRIGEDDGLNNGEGSGNDDSDSDDDRGSEDDGSSTGQAVFPAAPELISPIHLENDVSIAPQLQWSSVDGADYYILHMSRSNPNGMVLDVTTEDTTYTPTEVLGDDARHHWRVRAVKDGEMGEWTGINFFDTMNAEFPPMADLVGPDHYSENVGVYPELQWESVEADRFRIRILHKESSELIVLDESESTIYTPVEALEAETDYIWQVKSVIGGNEGAWGPRWEFSTGEYAYNVGRPVLLSPDRGAEHNTLIPTFEWQNVDADHYIILVSEEPPSNAKRLGAGGDDDPVIVYEEIGESVYTPAEPLDPEKIYYWRVKAVKDAEDGEWSETWEFKTPKGHINVFTHSGEKPHATELKQNYPNPFNPVTQIEFTLADVQNVSITVFNIAGQQVATLVDGFLQAGRHTATFDAGNLASGVYIYRFISNDHQFTKKMTLVK